MCGWIPIPACDPIVPGGRLCCVWILANEGSDKNDMFFIVVDKNSSLKFLAVKIVSAVAAYCNYKKWAIYTASNKQQHCNNIRGVEWRRQPYHRVSRLEQRQHVSPRWDNTQIVDLGGSDQDDTIMSCIVYFRSWLSARLSVATKRTRSGHGKSAYLPRMLGWVIIS